MLWIDKPAVRLTIHGVGFGVLLCFGRVFLGPAFQSLRHSVDLLVVVRHDAARFRRQLLEQGFVLPHFAARPIIWSLVIFMFCPCNWLQKHRPLIRMRLSPRLDGSRSWSRHPGRMVDTLQSTPRHGAVFPAGPGASRSACCCRSGIPRRPQSTDRPRSGHNRPARTSLPSWFSRCRESTDQQQFNFGGHGLLPA